MKHIHTYLLLVLVVLSCNVQVDKPETINEVYEPTDEELFAACADLQGIGQFIIGKTTFKNVLNDKDFKNSSSSFDRETNLYNGHWGYDFWKTKNDDISSGFDKRKWIEKEAKGRIKQLIPQFSGIKIGDLDFDKFDMAFLNDTLVAIYFYPDDKIETDVIDHYKEKYGNGRGHYKYSSSRVQVGDDVTATTSTDEVRTWANENVALDFNNTEYFHMEPGAKPTGYYEHSLLIYSKSRYPVFEELLKSLSKQYDENMQQSKSNTLNTL
jgi:hypothetical protein